MKQTARKSVGGAFPGGKKLQAGGVQSPRPPVESTKVETGAVLDQVAAQAVRAVLADAASPSSQVSVWDTSKAFPEQLEAQKARWRGKRGAGEPGAEAVQKKRKTKAPKTGPKRHACSARCD